MKIFSFIFGLLFSLNLFAAAQFGTFIVVKGKVFIENPKGERTEAKTKSVIYPGDTIISEADSSAKIVLSDRNVINVHPNTKLKIEKYSNESNDKNVDIRVIEGTSRFDVNEKYDGKTTKFEVKTTVAVVGVRGTKFVVSHDSSSNTTVVTTIEGKVEVTKIGTLTDIMGFGENGKLFINAKERIKVVKRSFKSEIETLKAKDFEKFKKETNVIGDGDGSDAGIGH
jgi:hypothetical protein